MRAIRRLTGAAVLAGWLLPVPAAAQGTGDILGRVTDATGGAMPGATVTVVNSATKDMRTTTTNESGDYTVTLLPIGRYTVTIDMTGFVAQKAEVELATGDRARLDAKLDVAQVAETVSVQAATRPLLQTDSSTVSSLVTQKAVQDLPVAGRNFVRFVQLVPGAFEGDPNSIAGGGRPAERRQTSAVSINGALDNQNNQLIDGMDNNQRAIGTVGVKPSVDAIAEIRVETSKYSAEFGRTAGGVVNIITKSGTNNYSGSAYEFFRNDRFDARDFFASAGPKPKYHQNQYGGSLGGPVVHDRTFFFADYEGYNILQGVTSVVNVPTAKMRAGDFSELSTPIYDPLTSPRTPFAGNVIPTNRLDPIALEYLNLYPLPTGPGLSNNYTGTRDRTQDSHTTDVRIDHTLGRTGRLFGRYSYNNVRSFAPPVFPAVDGIEPGGGGSFPGENKTTAHGIGGSFVKVFSDSLVAEVKLAYLKLDISSYNLNYGQQTSASFGLPNINLDAVTSGLMPMTITGYAGLGDATFLPVIQADNTWQTSVTLTKIHGPHSLKAGAGIIDRRFTVYQSNSPLGTMTFNASLTDNGAGAGGNSLASFLLGYPQQVSRSVSLFYPYYSSKEPFGYVQDDWRVSSSLTVNLGLRYDIYTPYTERNDYLVNLDLASSTVLLAGKDGVSRTAGIETDYSNVAPRLGFSWSLPARTVVRGGFGLTYFPGNYMSQSFLKSPPYTYSYGPVISNGASGGTPNLLLASGTPLPTIGEITVPSGTFQAESLDFKNTRVRQYNIVVEKEIAGNVVGAGYLGWSADRYTQYIANVNLAPAGPGAIQPRRAFAATLPNVSQISLIASDYEAAYDAMQLTFQRRARAGLTLSSSYTLAHATMTNAAPWDANVVERYDADLDVRHRFVLSANYELPFFRQRSGVLAGVLGGWQLNAIGSWQTGLPFTVTNGTARSNTGGTDRPDQIGDPTLDDPTIQQWFNVQAFAAQPINTVGNTGRNTLHGPSQRRLDLSLFKTIGLGGPARLQLRVEAYNVTNTPSFANPNPNFGTAGFGSISSTVLMPRQMQFAVKVLF